MATAQLSPDALFLGLVLTHFPSLLVPVGIFSIEANDLPYSLVGQGCSPTPGWERTDGSQRALPLVHSPGKFTLVAKAGPMHFPRSQGLLLLRNLVTRVTWQGQCLPLKGALTVTALLRHPDQGRDLWAGEPPVTAVSLLSSAMRSLHSFLLHSGVHLLLDFIHLSSGHLLADSSIYSVSRSFVHLSTIDPAPPHTCAPFPSLPLVGQ